MRPFPVGEWGAGSPHALSCAAGRAPHPWAEPISPSRLGGQGPLTAGRVLCR